MARPGRSPSWRSRPACRRACFNLVQGGDATGRALVAAGVDGVAFTGSAEAGHAIARELHARRAAAPAGGRDGRQEPGDRHGECRPRPRRRGHRPLGLRALRPEVQLVLARGRRRVGPRRAGREDRRPARGGSCSAILPTAATNLGPVVGADATDRFDAAVADARARRHDRDRRHARRQDFVQPTLVTGSAARPPPHARRAVPPVPHRHRRRLVRRRDGGGQRGRVRADRGHLQRGPRRARRRSWSGSRPASCTSTAARERPRVRGRGSRRSRAGSRAACRARAASGRTTCTQFMREQSRTVMTS